MRKLLFLLSIFAIVLSCSSDETSTPVTPPPAPIVKYTITLSAGEGGTVSTTGGEYEAGQTVSVTATPQGEYVFTSWSDGNTNATRTITVSSNSTLTANFEKRKYPLTLNIEGEGEVLEEIIDAGRTTDYDSGTTVKLTAVPAEGWEFVGWTGGIESTELEVQLLVSEAKEINAEFKKIELASLVLNEKSKMFTKGIADTLLIPINIPGGFKGIKINSQDGIISITSKPLEGALEGEIVLNYTNQKVNNVDWDRTIAGYDNISFEIEDLIGNVAIVDYKLRTQPGPKNYNYSKSSANYSIGQSDYRAKVNLNLIQHLNRRGELLFQPLRVLGCEDEVYSGISDIAEVYEDPSAIPPQSDENLYFGTKWNKNLNTSGYNHPTYIDLNMDGYEDLILSNGSLEGDCFSCTEMPIELYFYEDGKFLYKEIQFTGFTSIPKFYLPIYSISDLDNDGDPDIIIGSQVDGQDIIGNTLLLENKINENGTINITNLSSFTNKDHPVTAIVDINLDGLNDIFLPTGDFLINKGNFQFEYVLNKNDFFINSNPNFDSEYEARRYTGTLTHPSFIDVDGDGILDYIVSDFENRNKGLLERGVTQNDINLLGPPTKVYWGSIKNTGRFLRFGNSTNHLHYSYDNFTELKSNFTEYIGVSNIIVKDINYDGKKEIVLQRGNEKGYYIQVLSLNGRNFTDISTSIIDNNIKNNPLGFDSTNWCMTSENFYEKLRIEDINDDGFYEIFVEINIYPRVGLKEHFWKFTGSSYKKTTPNDFN